LRLDSQCVARWLALAGYCRQIAPVFAGLGIRLHEQPSGI
jgi:hypothetical protein